MSDPTRRRRPDDDESGGGFPLFPLILVVILAGLLLGGLLAHFLGGRRHAKVVRPVPLFTVSPLASSAPPTLASPLASFPPTARPTAAPTPGRKHPSPSPSPRATTSVSPRATASASPRASASVSPRPASSPSRSPSATPTPRRVLPGKTTPRAPEPGAAKATTAKLTEAKASPSAPAPGYSAAPAAGSGTASQVVRAYLDALARGDRATATGYLTHGLPNESFMDSNARIVSIRSQSAGSGSYKTTADVQASSGEYYITFTLTPGPGGLQISDHYAIEVAPKNG